MFGNDHGRLREQISDAGTSETLAAADGTSPVTSLVASYSSYGAAEAASSGQFEYLSMTQLAGGAYRLDSTGNRDLDATLIGTRWTGSELTFSFPTEKGVYLADGQYESEEGTEPSGFLVFNQTQQQLARYALGLISSYTGLKLTAVEETLTTHATLRFANTYDASVESAQAEFPGGSNAAGDVWFGMTNQPYYLTPAVGNWGAATIMHELGHAMGLKHGHQDYRREDLSDDLGFDGTLYGMPSLTPSHDGQAWSLMTYSAAPGQSGAFYGEGYNQPQTYMQLDIAALQYLYGANFDFHAEDTIYRWNARTGTPLVNGIAGPKPTSNKIFMTVWDGNGIDTYDLSNYRTDLKIDLRPGEFSTFSVQQVVNTTAAIGSYHPAPGNVANALLHANDPRSLIENAIGGSGNDTFVGNEARNQFVMNAGDDTAYMGSNGGKAFGGPGNDTVFGGSGMDVLYGDDGDDALSGFEGNDRLIGGAGNDALSGGTGVDLFKVTDGIDVIDDIGLGGRETLAVSDGATAAVTLGDAWTAGRATRNDGTVDVATDGLAVNLSLVTLGTNGFNVAVTGTVGTLLVGSQLDDDLTGGMGNDRLIGNLGRDVLIGGAGKDVLNGGEGGDIFQFAALEDLGLGVSSDIIYDFLSLAGSADLAAADKIDVSAIDPIPGGEDDAFRFVDALGTAEDPAWVGSLWVTSYRTSAFVNISTDADSHAEYQMRLVGVVASDIQPADFFL